MAKPPVYHMKTRMIIVLVGMVVIGFGLVLHQLFRLQIVEGAYYQDLALGQQLRTEPIGASRGTIYDTNGKALAKSATVYTVCVSAHATVKNGDEKKTKENQDMVANLLNRILGVDKESVYKKLKDTGSQYARVKTRVEQPQVDELRKEISENGLTNMIFFEENTRRYYPYGNFASAVLGFTDVDNVGAYGLESYYEKTLAGTPGRVVALRNNYNVSMPRQYEQRFDAEDGNSLVLTIDETIQHFLEKNLEIAVDEHHVNNRVCGIVMDVKSGAVLAMSTKPDFDPNNPSDILDENAKKKLEELNTAENKDEYIKAQQEAWYAQWRNKAISDPYEPGSVFKIITVSSALESGAVTAQSSFYCPGYKEVAGRLIHCWIWGSRQQGHGQQDLTHAVMNSCNPAFIEIGQRMGAETFSDYFDNYGLTEETGIELPGEAGSIYYEKLSLANLSSCAFGQSFKVTPIQLITACSAAVNGGKLMQPYIVRQVIDADGDVVSTTEPRVKRQVISEEISKEVCLMLEQVVGGGGSGKQAAIPGYRIGGKTGTSEKLDKARDPLPSGNARNTLSFFGFAPVDDPQVACLILVDEPDIYNAYGSTIAAPIVGSVLADTLPYLGIEPQFSEEELEEKEITMDYLINRDIHDAEAFLRTAGIKFRTVGSGTKVLNQVPGAGEKLPAGGTVVLYTEEGVGDNMCVVPDVLGKNLEEANKLIVGERLNIAVTGDDIDGGQNLRAVAQNPPAGTELKSGSIVQVQFLESETPPASSEG